MPTTAYVGFNINMKLDLVVIVCRLLLW